MTTAVAQSVALIATALWAQTSPWGSWPESLLTGGPFAVILLLVVMDKIGTHGERDRLRVENESLRSEIRDLNANMRNEVVPALVEQSKLTERLLALDDPPARRRRE